ncbi:hypothetical protein [Spirosoma rhododendri]|uniref:hypothetical protein n=1 Tax=Spirosoma rhododendri TaxID=2728024 RepID=UPI0020C306C5|nr:hypothetical protein [Spirosoma rhododendri]
MQATTERTDLPARTSEKFEHLWHLVGNTPMLELFYTDRGHRARSTSSASTTI